MATIAGVWTGKITGTNTGNIFFEVDESSGRISGIGRVDDPMYGTSVYSLAGSREDDAIHMEMDPITGTPSQLKIQTEHADERPINVQVAGIQLGHVVVSGRITNNKRIEGRWHSTEEGICGAFLVARPETHIARANKFSGEDTENIVFIMMGLPEANTELEGCILAIKRASHSHGLAAVSADEIEQSGRTTNLILEKIEKSRVLVCDVTTGYSNVCYRLGYAYGLKKEVVLVAKQGASVPFDIQNHKIIFYKNVTDLEVRVARRIGEEKETALRTGVLRAVK